MMRLGPVEYQTVQQIYRGWALFGFVVYGALWLGGLVGFVRGERWGWRAMAAGAVGSLWYLLIGTLHSVLILGLLLTPPVRRAFGERPQA